MFRFTDVPIPRLTNIYILMYIHINESKHLSNPCRPHAASNRRDPSARRACSQRSGRKGRDSAVGGFAASPHSAGGGLWSGPSRGTKAPLLASSGALP